MQQYQPDPIAVIKEALQILERSPLPAPPPRRPPAASGWPYGVLRQQILACLARYPDGCTRIALQDATGAAHNLREVLKGMVRAGVIRRLAPGVFALPVRPAPARSPLAQLRDGWRQASHEERTAFLIEITRGAPR